MSVSVSVRRQYCSIQLCLALTRVGRIHGILYVRGSRARNLTNFSSIRQVCQARDLVQSSSRPLRASCRNDCGGQRTRCLFCLGWKQESTLDTTRHCRNDDIKAEDQSCSGAWLSPAAPVCRCNRAQNAEATCTDRHGEVFSIT